MKKFSVFSAMLIILLALSLALAACDSGGDGGGGGGGGGGGVDTGGDVRIVMNILNNDSRDVAHIKVEQDSSKVIYDRDYTIKAGATAAVNINTYSNMGWQFVITFTFSDGGNSWLYWYKGAIQNEVMKTDPYR